MHGFGWKLVVVWSFIWYLIDFCSWAGSVFKGTHAGGGGMPSTECFLTRFCAPHSAWHLLPLFRSLHCHYLPFLLLLVNLPFLLYSSSLSACCVGTLPRSHAFSDSALCLLCLHSESLHAVAFNKYVWTLSRSLSSWHNQPWQDASGKNRCLHQMAAHSACMVTYMLRDKHTQPSSG